jgi:hypothetical protein
MEWGVLGGAGGSLTIKEGTLTLPADQTSVSADLGGRPRAIFAREVASRTYSTSFGINSATITVGDSNWAVSATETGVALGRGWMSPAVNGTVAFLVIM